MSTAPAEAPAAGLGWWIRVGLTDDDDDGERHVQVETQAGSISVEELVDGFVGVQPYAPAALFRVGLAMIVADAAARTREAFARSPPEGIRALLDLEEAHRARLHAALSIVPRLAARINGTEGNETIETGGDA